MLKAVILNNDPAQVEYVYGRERLDTIRSLVDLAPGIVSGDRIDSYDWNGVEIIFSTWGMVPLREDQLDRMKDLKIVFYGAGATDYFAKNLLARGIRVMSAWKANAIPVAEFCLAQILLGLKGYFRDVRSYRATRRMGHQTEAGPGIYGATVALIGAGAISLKLQELLRPFEVEVLVVPSRPERRTVSLEEAFRRAQVVSNHLPNRDDNAGVLDGHLFSLMRPGAVFLNTGRGRQVNEAELAEVLHRRPDLTALLDVTDPEPLAHDSLFFELENVIVSSHIAGSLNDEVRRMADYVIGDLRHYLAGEALDYEIDADMLMTH